MCNENPSEMMAEPATTHAVNRTLYAQLQQRFPEVPDYVVKGFMSQNKNDPLICVQLLKQESDRYLYAEGDGQLDESMNAMQLHDPERRKSSPCSQSSNSSTPKTITHVNSVPHMDGLSYQQNQFHHSNSTPSLTSGLSATPPPAHTMRPYVGAHTAPIMPPNVQPFYVPYDASGAYSGSPRQGYDTRIQNWMVDPMYSPPDGGGRTNRPISADGARVTGPTAPLYVNVGDTAPSAGENYRQQVYLNLATGGSSHSSPVSQSIVVQRQASNISQGSTSSRHSDPAGNVYYPQRQPSQTSTGSRHSNHSGDRSTPPPVYPTYSHHVGPPSRPSVLDLSVAPFLNSAVPQGSRGTPGEDPAYIQALIQHQRARMEQLVSDITVLRSKITHLHKELAHKDNKLCERRDKELTTHAPPVSSDEIKKLRETNRCLSIDIQCMTREIDLFNNGQVPLGIYDPAEQENFFRHMSNTGQHGPVPPPPIPPHTPNRPPLPPRIPITQRPAPAPPVVEPVDDDKQWSCSYCTYLNHPALDKCEVCEMPRITASSNPPEHAAGVSPRYAYNTSPRPDSHTPPGYNTVCSTPGRTVTSPYAVSPSPGHTMTLPPGYSFSDPSGRNLSSPQPPPCYVVSDPSGHVVASSTASTSQSNNRTPQRSVREGMLCTRTDSGDWEIVDP